MAKSLKNKNILIGVTGGISIYKILDLISMLRKEEANVKVIMTKHAKKFVTPLTFKTISGNQVYDDTFKKESPENYDINHISLSKYADIFLIAPASANIISKFATGIADDLLSTTYLSINKTPILLAPAMNTNMLNKDVIKRNLSTLKKDGVKLIDPVKKRLACGDTGEGALADNKTILLEIKKYI